MSLQDDLQRGGHRSHGRSHPHGGGQPTWPEAVLAGGPCFFQVPADA